MLCRHLAQGDRYPAAGGTEIERERSILNKSFPRATEPSKLGNEVDKKAGGRLVSHRGLECQVCHTMELRCHTAKDGCHVYVR